MFGRKKREDRDPSLPEVGDGVFEVTYRIRYMVLPEFMQEAEDYFGDLEPEIFEEWVKKVHGLRLDRNRKWNDDGWCTW